MTKIEPDKIASAPLFAFNNLNNPASQSYWGQAIYDKVWSEWEGTREKFRLPYSEVYCYFHYDSLIPTHNLYHLVQNDDLTIYVETWSWQPTLSSLQAKWTRQPCVISFDPKRPDEYGLEWPFDPDKVDPYWLEERLEDARANISVSVAALQLLDRVGATTREDDLSASVVKTNVKRERVKLDPLDRPIIVSIDDREAVLSDQRAASTLSQRSPHDRRGHWRNYRSGQRVWVRSCKIHGGRTNPATYLVT
ncbi:hypothetical protein [uncultured Sphingomonas sp.]|uniref:hypothetical protein n=1 Tax=uncultured Sphingomonas sp. TaxID=158754 RepID=UPI00262248B1|nr:hypothetical protein [uncultured Sphingomonas sp.]